MSESVGSQDSWKELSLKVFLDSFQQRLSWWRQPSLSSASVTRLCQNWWPGQVGFATEESTRMVQELEWMAVEEVVVKEHWTEVDVLEGAD